MQQSFTIEDIKLQREVMHFLENIHYLDSPRIAKEIVEFVNRADPNKAGTIVPALLARFAANEPWEYIRGTAEFCGMDFAVNRHTLIPRPETELLVEIAAREIQGWYHGTSPERGRLETANILDVGTGSGAIIVSIAKKIIKISQSLNFYATDISPEALKVAKKNAETLIQEITINFLQADLIAEVPLQNTPTFIIANLPYIPTETYRSLDSSVLDYEPQTALDGGADGCHYYKALIKQIQTSKLNQVYLFLETDPEINPTMTQFVKQTLPGTTICFTKDYREVERFMTFKIERIS